MATARLAIRAPLIARAGFNASKVNRLAVPRRFNSSKSHSTPKPSGSSAAPLVGLAIASGLGYFAYNYFTAGAGPLVEAKTADNATFEDYQSVYNSIAKRLQEVDDDPQEGSYGPALVRFAWHSSGTYDKHKNDGGSGCGTMRFDQEVNTGANAGLVRCRTWIEPIHKQYPWISHGDLYTLGGVVAIQELGGPTIKWRPGRVDAGEDRVPPDGRLPDAAQGANYVRDLFGGRMGFSETEIVALIGAHALGRCHKEYSGYDGPWTFSPTYFTNDFYKLLRDEKWQVKKWDGPKQFEDVKTKSLMMLPADHCLIEDKEFKKIVSKFADDQDYFFEVFAKSFSTLLELGVNFKPSTAYYEFKRLDDQ